MLHRWAPPTQAIRLQTLEPDGLFAAQRVAAGRHPMRRPKWGASQSLPPSLPPVVEGRHGLETLSRLLFGAGRGHAPPATQWVATPIPPPLVQCAPQNKTAGDRDARPCTPAALRAAGTPPFRPPAPGRGPGAMYWKCMCVVVADRRISCPVRFGTACPAPPPVPWPFSICTGPLSCPQPPHPPLLPCTPPAAGVRYSSSCIIWCPQ